MRDDWGECSRPLSCKAVQSKFIVSHARLVHACRQLFIGASVSEPLPSDVNVNFVCLSVVDRRGPTGVRHGNGACVSFLHVAVYVTMVTLFRQSIDSTHLTAQRYSEVSICDSSIF